VVVLPYGNRLGRVVDHAGHRVIEQVGPHAGKVSGHFDPHRPQVGRRADTGRQQQLRGPDRPGGQHHLAGATHRKHVGAHAVVNSGAAVAVQADPVDQRAGDHVQVGTM
jgi:hypothetical protein